VRLAFSVAAHLEPDILLVDEVLAVGDAEFQQRSLGRMEDLSGTGRTVLLVSHNMQAINQLCDRAILLEDGQIAMDGVSSEVISRYLHSVSSTGSGHTWPDDESAPGDDLVRLRAVRVVDESGSALDAADVRQTLGIEITFKVLQPGRAVFPKLKLWGPQGEMAFNALDTSPVWHPPTPPGEYTSTAWIPANLLNEGTASVDVAVCSLHAPKLYQHAAAYGAVAFNVYDPGDGDSARGKFTGQLRGAVRPLLEWTTEEL
jgi:lipopolysaccharide transport system ATP-binding protein